MKVILTDMGGSELFLKDSVRPERGLISVDAPGAAIPFPRPLFA
jgi:hypothetical protein